MAEIFCHDFGRMIVWQTASLSWSPTSRQCQAIFVTIVMIMMILGTHGSMLTNHSQKNKPNATFKPLAHAR
ncbi:hypothetical protein [Moraxella sp.]|uniref:hypothetical protein n=1 Tax=Moraxella sp. TaxID=479 RepID=UPI0026DB6706|nr:hypothetical protein [Moraxella sp.]MDO4895272.1 hypothetical protein [Moraxella sp.]